MPESRRTEVKHYYENTEVSPMNRLLIIVAWNTERKSPPK